MGAENKGDIGRNIRSGPRYVCSKHWRPADLKVGDRPKDGKMDRLLSLALG